MNYSKFSKSDEYTSVFNKHSLQNAYIVLGPDSVDKQALIHTLAAAMVCPGENAVPCMLCRSCRKASTGIHPDIILVEPEKTNKTSNYTSRQIHDIIRDAYIKPNDSSHKVYIFNDCSKLTVQCQNILLKLLEEPPAFACFVLNTDRQLIDTIVSRCTTIRCAGDSAIMDENALERGIRFTGLLSASPLELTEYLRTLTKMTPAEMQSFADAACAAIAAEFEKETDMPEEKRERYIKAANALRICRNATVYNLNSLHLTALLTAALSGD